MSNVYYLADARRKILRPERPQDVVDELMRVTARAGLAGSLERYTQAALDVYTARMALFEHKKRMKTPWGRFCRSFLGKPTTNQLQHHLDIAMLRSSQFYNDYMADRSRFNVIKERFQP
jgi:hypothetical protein